MQRDRDVHFSQWLALAGGAIAVTLAIGLAPVLSAGQAQPPPGPPKGYIAPHTPWGEPDLQAVWTNWDRTPFQGPNTNLEEIAEAAEAAQEAYGAEGRGDGAGGGMAGIHSSPVSPKRFAQVVDPPNGRVPTVAAKIDRRPVSVMGDTWENHGGGTRCITHGAPGGLLASGADGYSKAYRLMQSPGVVVLLPEMFHDARIVRIGGTHPGASIRLWNGDSIGRWEGDTLVVDTTNFNEKGEAKGNVPQTNRLHLIERFMRTGPTTMRYEATFDDPDVYTARWTAMQQHNADPKYVIYEFACHEGNTRFMLGTLKQGRDRDAEAAAKRKTNQQQ
jgi:hypothetical protein